MNYFPIFCQIAVLSATKKTFDMTARITITNIYSMSPYNLGERAHGMTGHWLTGGVERRTRFSLDSWPSGPN
jgi:hypothetical protein